MLLGSCNSFQFTDFRPTNMAILLPSAAMITSTEDEELKKVVVVIIFLASKPNVAVMERKEGRYSWCERQIQQN